ncbi:MAG: hypothetical protein ABIO29_09195 [Sphingomicrobium sp.]
MVRFAPFLAAVVIGGCSPVGGPYPSLQPRAAEAVDPRLLVPEVVNDRPVSVGLAARLSSLVAEARRGDDAFAPAAATAERLAASAGPPQSESWIAAQQALSAAQAARQPTAQAMGDVDALAAGKLADNGGIAPNDLKAINDAAATIGRIDSRQQAVIAATLARLGG